MKKRPAKKKKPRVEPWAYAVDCPPGHEFDYLLFAELVDAESHQYDFLNYDRYESTITPLVPDKRKAPR